MKMESKVALITGGNAGVGFSVADRLLTDHDHLHVCLACRNRERAENARQSLLKSHPQSEVSVIIVDTSCMDSVFAACKEIKTRFKRLDYLYLNAGIMTVIGLNFKKLAGLLTGASSVQRPSPQRLPPYNDASYCLPNNRYPDKSKALKILSNGHGILVHENSATPEDLQLVFATNLFGHYVMVRELEDCLGGPGTSVIVWTSSLNADKESFDCNDIQHRNGTEPYSSSKYAMDVLSVSLNDQLNKKGIYSVTTCPGFVISAMTLNIFPAWVWMLAKPFLLFMRLFVPGLNISAHNGAEALVWASKQKTESFNSRLRYLSNCSVLGNPYVGVEKLCIEEKEMISLNSQLDSLYHSFKKSQD